VTRLLRSPLLRNTGWMFLAQVLGYGFRLLYFVGVARLLGVVEYGVVVGAFALVNLVAPYCSLGAGRVLLRYVSAGHDQYAPHWANVLIITLATSGFVTIGLRLLAPHVLDSGGVSVILTTSIAVCVCEQVVIAATHVFLAFQDMRIAAVLNQSVSMLRTVTVGGMLVVMHHASARQWCAAMMVSSIVAAATAISVVSARYGAPRFVPGLALKHAGEGIEYAFASSQQSAYNDLDKAMLSHYGMDAANGVYSMAYRAIDVASVPVASIQLAADPRLFELAAQEPREAVRLGRRLLGRGFILSILTSVMLVLLAPVLPLIVGKGFAEGASALRWLAPIPVFRAVHGITGSVLTGIGWQRCRTVSQMIAVVFNLILNLWLIPRHGWRGAAWASLATDGALAVMNWGLMKRAERQIGPAGPQPGTGTVLTNAAATA
jgi:O-antigen/teichoic acid export membrane protein